VSEAPAPPTSGLRVHYVVVGAGIVGVCCALYLLRAGCRVTLIDRNAPGSGCSFGNAGLIQTGACVPLATPSLLWRLPRMLLDSTGPLVIRWRDLPSMLNFLMKFAGSARRVEQISLILGAALGSASDTYRTLLKDAGLLALIRKSGELYVYERESSYEAAKHAHELRRRRGVDVVYLSGAQARGIEPALSECVIRAVMLPDTLATVDPFLLTSSLAEHFRSAGGTVLMDDVLDIQDGPDDAVNVVTTTTNIVADGAVLAAGVESTRIARSWGLSVPLQAERGYHVMIEGQSPLRTPVVSGDYRFGVIPLTCGTRLVGSSELASLARPPDYSRIGRLLPLARRLVPALQGHPTSVWMGARPSMPDGLPIISRSPRSNRVLFAFGHGHLGLTLAAFTGRLIRDLALTKLRQPACFSWPRQLELPSTSSLASADRMSS
jgi:D-amino-acid dehydrogenase